MRYFILIKQTGTKKWKGAIPAKKGVSKEKLRKTVGKQIKKGFSYKIVSESVLRKYMLSLVKKKRSTTKKRKTTRKRTKKRRKR